MDSEWIDSLCYVSKQNDRTKELCRVADCRNGCFDAYAFDPNQDFYGTERDLVYGKLREISSAQGSFGMFSWRTYQLESGEWRTDAKESDTPWIEVIYTLSDTPEQIVAALKKGIRLETAGSRPHDRIFCCSRRGADAVAVYVPEHLLSSANGISSLVGDVNALETGKLDLSGVASCRCRYYLSDSVRYLRSPFHWRALGKVEVRGKQEIIAGVVQSHVRRMHSDGIITRGEKKTYQTLLGKLSKETLLEEIARQINCNLEEAQRYADRYFAGCEGRLERDEADWIMRRLIENDGEYVQELSEKVEKKWKGEHDAQMREAANEMAELRFKAQKLRKDSEEQRARLQAELQDVQREIADANAALTALNEKRAACEARIGEAEQLRADVERQIQERLRDIREDRARALVDEAWFQAVAGSSYAAAAPMGGACTVAGDGDAGDVPEVELNERLRDAIDIWSALSNDNQRGSDLAAFFLAAYALRQNLIITGECAERIADLAALIATGRRAAKLKLCDGAREEDVARALEAVPHRCVCLMNGLDGDLSVVYALLHRFADTQFILIAPYGESLFMEPEGLFTTFLPVLSEEFRADGDVEEPERRSCEASLRSAVSASLGGRQLRTERLAQGSWFADGFYAPLLVERCARMRCAVRAICARVPGAEDRAKRTLLTMLYAPLMKCLRKGDVLSANRAEFEILGERERGRLLAFVGVGSEIE